MIVDLIPTWLQEWEIEREAGYMPVKIKKVDGYQVRTPGGVKAKHTTKAKAEAQRRLLQGIEHGMIPRKQKKKK